MATLKKLPVIVEKAIDAGADEEEGASLIRGETVVNPASSAGFVAHGFGRAIFDRMPVGAPNHSDVANAIELLAESVKAGDLGHLEEMLVGQAIALQGMFTTFAMQAASGGSNAPVLTNLALRAQAQSRATIDSIVNLKNPRTTVFTKQANIAAAGGQQQVNNGVPTSHAPAREAIVQNELLTNGDPHGMDAGTPRAASRRNQKVEAVGVVHRTTKQRGARRVVT